MKISSACWRILKMAESLQKEGFRISWRATSFAGILMLFLPRLKDATREMTRILANFEMATTAIDPGSSRDLLKRLYQYLVPQEVRHRLGEYYTPDWLAELVIEKTGSGGEMQNHFLDPACGSGDFFFLAIRRIREYSKQKK